MDPFALAKFPFLSEAREYMLAQGIGLDDLTGGAALGRAREVGERRVTEAVEHGAVHEHPVAGEADAVTEIFSYPIARMIVSCCEDAYIVSRYALAEGVRASSLLAKEDVSMALTAARELGMEAASGDGGLSVHVTDFLRYSAQMRSPEWKLSNQDLRRGRVVVAKDRLCRLVQQALQERIEGELPLPVNKGVIDALERPVARIKAIVEQKRKEIKPQEMGRISFLRMPPCMKAYIRMVEAGKNVPHSARFALVAFLHAIGMKNEEIMAVFATSPDFNEQMTRYQVDHITGASSGVEYLPPECGTMKSYGVCVEPDSLCARPWMHHPLTYYRVKGRPAGAKKRAADHGRSQGGERPT